MDDIFRALGDPHRRKILDLLRVKDGLTLSEIETSFPQMTRFGVMKHLKIFEDVLLIAPQKVGRFKYHYLNPVPLQEMSDRWIAPFGIPWSRSLINLKHTLERTETMTKPQHVYVSLIKTTPDKLWDALTNSAHTPLYYYGASIKSDLKPGSDFNYMTPDGQVMVGGQVIEATPSKKLVTTFVGNWDPAMHGDKPSRVTWEIEAVGDCCRLTVTHDDFNGETATYKTVGGGWPGILSGLKTYLETGEALGYNPMAA